MKCLSPIFLPDLKISVPCGRCAACKMRRSLDWSTRLRIHSEHSKSCYWVTLTYDSYHLPVVVLDGDQSGAYSHMYDVTDDINTSVVPTLCKSDLTGFLNRFRHRQGCEHVKYFAVGEYGNKEEFGHRPHYHIIMFFDNYRGIDNMYYDVTMAWMRNGYSMGNVQLDGLIDAQIFYACGYTQSKDIEFWPNQEYAVKPFRHMSKGLGIDYLKSRTLKKNHPDLDPTKHYVIINGKKMNMPRYYSDKIYSPVGKLKYSQFLYKQLKDAPPVLDPNAGMLEHQQQLDFIRRHNNRKQQI